MKNLCFRILHYSSKVYSLMQRIKSIKDGRINPCISIETVFLSLFLGFATRVPSFNELESRNRDEFLKILGQSPSAETLVYTLERADLRDIKDMLIFINQKARRNKVFRNGTIDGYIVCALDGTRLYSTEVSQDDIFWRKTEKTNGDEIWHVDMVFLSYVGNCSRLMLGVEPIFPGEGETTAAYRLLEDAYSNYYRYCDIITADALYAKAPFINQLREQNKDVVIRVKQENYDIISDIEGLVSNTEPDKVLTDITPKQHKGEYSRYSYDLKIWDREGFTSWDGVSEPLRCLKIVETKKKIVHGKVVEKETKTIYLVTTCDKAIVPALTVWKIAHRRWDIENSGFHDLKNNYNLNHCFTHEPKAIMPLILFMLIVFNLFILFFDRNLQAEAYKKETRKAIARKILTTARISRWRIAKAPT